MKIAINARVLNERKGGPARYTYNILKELARTDLRNTYYILLYDSVDFDFEMPGNFKVIVYKIKSKIIFDYFIIPYFTRRYKIDVSIFPKNTFSPLVAGKKIPFFNDIVYFEKLGFREFKFFDNLHHKIMIPVAGRLSYINLSISEYTAKRMTELLNIPPDRIRVILLGIEKSFRKIKNIAYLDRVSKKYGLRFPFFFYAGSLSPRKNMKNVILAFNKIKDMTGHRIYFTAGDSWRDEEIFRLIEENGLSERIIRLGFISDEELAAMYNLADCYLYPSIYEGFGLPILEAQACGCPVITSNVTSCPEVAGEGAAIVDPYNVDEIAGAMLKMTTDKRYRNRMIKKGYKNAAGYSWEKTTLVLKKILDGIES